ncbi:MAG TPA: hypothetical protein VFZ91_13590 [Allosphingosinicella sp.]
MIRRTLTCGAAAALLLAPPATAAAPVNLLAPEPAEPAPPPCAGAAAERAPLHAERAAINKTIGDIALGRHRRRKVSGGEVAAGIAGTAASVLLPFGVGALLGAGASAAAKGGRKKRKPAPPEPDVPAMIDRLHAIDARLLALSGCGE